MDSWLKLSLMLCFFGFLKEMRPSENFLFEYLTGKRWNLSSEQVQQKLMPIGTYTQLFTLVIVFLITDLWRYKPLIVTLAASGIVSWSLLAWGTTFLELQIMEGFYGTFFATEVAYYTYIYAKVPREHYAQVTSHTRAALLFGHGISGAVSQLLVEFKLLNYHQLNYITFSAMVAALAWALVLPSVENSIYFHSENNEGKSNKERYVNAFKRMKHHFFASYSQETVGKWSIWWALSTCGFIHVQAYMQPLWSTIIQGTNATLHNGIAETAMTITGFLGAISVGFLKVDWQKYGEVALSLCSILSAIFIIASSQANSLFISYACYTAYGGIYSFVITIATSEVAKYILEDSYGLVFGLNTVVALALQTLIVLVLVTGDLGWALNPRQQHFAYGLFHAGIAVVFILNAVIRSVKQYL